MASKYINTAYKIIVQANTIKQASRQILTSKYSSYAKSTYIEDFKPAVSEYEVSKSKTEWEYVERLLPPLTVPKPMPMQSYSTDWRPPTASPGDNKYFINRNRNHQIPVYMTSTHRGMRKLTEVHKIQGDIHAMENDLKAAIEQSIRRPVASQINELVGTITFKGDYVSIVKQYLLEKGF